MVCVFVCDKAIASHEMYKWKMEALNEMEFIRNQNANQSQMT